MPDARFKVEDAAGPRRAADPWTRSLADRIMRDARDGTPRGKTGRLRAGWRTVKAGRNAIYRVTNDVEYARFVEYGTRRMAPRAMLGRAVARHRGS